MIPAKAKVNIYRSSTNGFVFDFKQPDDTNFDLGLFEKIEAVLFIRGDRFNAIDTFDMQTMENVASLSFTPEKTEELFKANAYSFEIRMYDSETSFLVYVVVDLKFLDVFRPDGKVHGATVVVDENETATVTMSESSVFAALAQNAAEQSQQLLNELEAIRDQLQPIIDNQTELISLSQVEGLDTLANKIAEVEAVANNIANVVSVGENIGAVTDVQEITTQLLAVHERLTEVQAVGDNIANVNTVSDNITAVNTAANNIQAIINAPDFASDAQKHAQETIQFEDSNNITFEKGSKGWSQDAESSATDAGQSAQSASTSESNAVSSASAASDSATASEQSRQASESARNASQTARNESQTARDKSQEWAEQDEDVEVETGQFSSLHHSRKSEESATSASNSASAASTSETNAANSASSASTSEANAAASQVKSEKWAEEDEDVEVETGKFSAKHHSAKAQAKVDVHEAKDTEVHGIGTGDTIAGKAYVDDKASLSAIFVAASDADVVAKAVAHFVCDGENDASIVDQAVTKALTLSRKVVLSAGAFYFGTTSLDLPSGITIEGAGIGNTILVGAPNSGGVLRNKNRDVHEDAPDKNIVIQNLEVDGGRGDDPGNFAPAAWFQNVENCLISRCYFHNAPRHGFEFRASVNSRAEFCFFSNCEDDGLSISEAQVVVKDGVPNSISRNIVIENCYAWGNVRPNTTGTWGAGFEVDDGPKNITFNNCYAWGNIAGFVVHNHSDRVPPRNVSFINCYAYDNQMQGILISGRQLDGIRSSGHKIRGGSIYNNGGVGLYLSAETIGAIVDNVTIEGNNDGIVVHNVSAPDYATEQHKITNCIIRGNGQYGIYSTVNVEVKDLQISDCTITDHQREGIFLRSFGGGHIIHDNHINSNGTSDANRREVRVDDSDCQIKSNHIRIGSGASIQAIYVGSEGSNNIILFNDVRDSWSAGAIEVPATSEGTITDPINQDMTNDYNIT